MKKILAGAVAAALSFGAHGHDEEEVMAQISSCYQSCINAGMETWPRVSRENPAYFCMAEQEHAFALTACGITCKEITQTLTGDPYSGHELTARKNYRAMVIRKRDLLRLSGLWVSFSNNLTVDDNDLWNWSVLCANHHKIFDRLDKDIKCLVDEKRC